VVIRPDMPRCNKSRTGLVEFDQDVLAAPREPADLRAIEALGEHRRKRAAQIGGGAIRRARCAGRSS